VDYDHIHKNTRAHYAKLVNLPPDRIATGSQTSVLASVFAAAVPEGAEVLCVDGDFTSQMRPCSRWDSVPRIQVIVFATRCRVHDGE
jgi:selenocysteine lyase/cysteine desulfurase